MRSIIKFTPLIILLLIVFSCSNAFGQEKEKKPQDVARHRMHKRDSVLRSFNKSDTSISGLLQKIEQYATTFNQINNNLAEGLDTADISAGFPPVFRRINKIDSLTNTHKSSTLRYLAVLRDNLDHIQETLEGWQSDLEGSGTKLIQNQNELIKFAKDTSLRAMPSDSVMRRTFFAQRRGLRRLFRNTDSVNRVALLRLTLLQDKIAVAYTKVLDATDHIDAKIKRFAIKAFNGESDYIWNAGLQVDDFKTGLKSTLRLNRILYNYFIKNETVTHFMAFLFFIVVLSWIWFVRAKTLKEHENPGTILNQANYISKDPIIAAILLCTAIVPYFYDHPPIAFFETFFLASTILALVLVYKDHHRSCFKFLFGLFWLTIVFGISNLFIQITNIDRYVVLLLSIASAIIGFRYHKKVVRSPQDHIPYSSQALKIFVALQGLSILLNISGRFSLAKIIGITAIFNLWFLVILFFVVQIITQACFLQFQVKKDGRSIINWIDYNVVQKNFRNVIFTLAAILWSFFLLQNLNIDDWVRDVVTDLLDQPRTVVGASFTFGGFVIFIAVIWLSSIFSKLISYFYDVSSQRVSDLSIAKKKNKTSTLLIRLGVFAVGFLLAVAASGFPLEKLTIIISAFGIGIGFGLQNIVNNLVSGVILAFEKPIQIGDIIEVANRTGTMNEIGIRSSKLLTSDGSEVIIPNGDLLSQHVVNWTLSNNNRRIELIVRVNYGTDILKVKEILNKILTEHPDIMQTSKPVVLLHNFNESAVEFRLLFWAADINSWVSLKSNVLSEIYTAFAAEGIEVPQSSHALKVSFKESGNKDAQPKYTEGPERAPAKEDPPVKDL